MKDDTRVACGDDSLGVLANDGIEVCPGLASASAACTAFAHGRYELPAMRPAARNVTSFRFSFGDFHSALKRRANVSRRRCGFSFPLFSRRFGMSLSSIDSLGRRSRRPRRQHSSPSRKVQRPAGIDWGWLAARTCQAGNSMARRKEIEFAIRT